MKKSLGILGVILACFLFCESASAMTIVIESSEVAVKKDVSSLIKDEVFRDVFDFIDDGEFYGVEISAESSFVTLSYEVTGDKSYRGYFFLKSANFFLDWDARYEEEYQFERPIPSAFYQVRIADGSEADLDSREGYIKVIAAASVKELDIPSYEGSWSYQGYGQMGGYSVQDSGVATISVNGSIITGIYCSGTKVSEGVSEDYSFSVATNSPCSYGAFQFQKDDAPYEVYMYDEKEGSIYVSVESGAGTDMSYTMRNGTTPAPAPAPTPVPTPDPTPTPSGSSGGGGCSIGVGLPIMLLLPLLCFFKE